MEKLSYYDMFKALKIGKYKATMYRIMPYIKDREVKIELMRYLEKESGSHK